MKVLIVDDDMNLAANIRGSLEALAHTVDTSTEGGDGAFLAKSYAYDAIILDYSMPKKDGLMVCREIRAAGKSTPIIFLSSTDDTDIKVQALKAGADDYITKPFSMNELLARLDAVTRRAPVIRDPMLTIGGVELDTAGIRVSYGGNQIRLTRKEFNLLEYLMRHRGIVISRPLILEHVWTADENPFSNTVEAHIRNIRKKLRDAGAPDLIVNVPGRGYLIDLPENIAAQTGK